MFTENNSSSREKLKINNLDKIRRNLRKWASTAHKTGLWAELSDEQLQQRLETVSHIKRFLEKYCLDEHFRKEFLRAGAQTIKKYKLQIEPEDLNILSEIDQIKELATSTSVPITENLQHFHDFARERLQGDELKEISSISINTNFKVWREKQIARSRFQIPKSHYESIIHSPVCFELSKGCSVGCYFCAISAPRLGDIFLYTPENMKLWREVLEFLRETLGDAAGAGFGYWATDPFDNPDYEKFMTDFYEILGVFPQTTTAQPMTDPDRVRSLLKLSLDKGCKLNRFSILSLKMLNQLHDEFSAEELIFAGLVPVNPGARVLTQLFPFKTIPTKKINAGRALERNQKQANSSNNDFQPGTIACVTGFLFNMVERSVKLISPCTANERWPQGYIIFDEGTFFDIDELRKLINNMIVKNMPLKLREEDLVSFHPHLEYQILADGFQLSTQWKTLCFRNYLESPFIPRFQKLGNLVKKGDKTAREIADIFAKDGISSSKTLEYLNALFKSGVLDDEPKLQNSTLDQLEA